MNPRSIHLFHLLFLFLLITPLSAQEKNTPPKKDDAFLVAELEKLTLRKEELETLARKEPDAKHRALIEQALLMNDELISVRQQEQITRAPRRRTELHAAGNEIQNELVALIKQIEANQEQKRIAALPTPTPTPVPATYKTDSGFRIRLRMTEK